MIEQNNDILVKEFKENGKKKTPRGESADPNIISPEASAVEELK